VLNKKEFVAGCLHTAVIVAGILAIASFQKLSSNVLPILDHPDPVLRQVAEPVTHVDDTIITLTDAMIATLRYQTLVDFFIERSVPRGLAAPQVGIARRLIVCGLNGRIVVMLNPEIIERSGTYVDHDDCLSVKEERKTVIERSAHVKVKYNTLDNKEKILAVKNDAAALIEHEIDHLNGVLNVDYEML